MYQKSVQNTLDSIQEMCRKYIGNISRKLRAWPMQLVVLCIVAHEECERPVKNHRCPRWSDSTWQEPPCQPDPGQLRCEPARIHHVQAHCPRCFREGRSTGWRLCRLGRAGNSGFDHRAHRSARCRVTSRQHRL